MVGPSRRGAGRPKPQSRSIHIRRLIEEALVDAYGEDEQHGAFLVMFEEHVKYPFTALVVGEEVEVRGFDWPGAPHEIVAPVPAQGSHAPGQRHHPAVGRQAPDRRGVVRRLPGLAQGERVAFVAHVPSSPQSRLTGPTRTLDGDGTLEPLSGLRSDADDRKALDGLEMSAVVRADLER